MHHGMLVGDESVPTMLHISDLHRTSEPRPSNDELIAAIVSDAKRWEAEGIPLPDLIVVSGDLIQGVQLDASDADSEIEGQYREVADFLRTLAQEFVDSDRSKVIVVPGNHDVHWVRSLSAMRPLATCPARTGTKAYEANSKVRWNWKDQRTYEIVDGDMYASRLELFRKFQRDFYEGLDPSPLPKVNGDLVFAEYPDLGLVVAGFASWHGNDCFCHVGDIDPSMLSASQKLLARSEVPIAVAVWHHSIVGGPRESDYMDQRVIHRLVDFGFHVGLHGHQHYAAAAPFELRLPNLTSMAVVGAGSLAVGDSALPMGERRQFNVVVIDPDHESITVHVRGMSPAGVFTGSHRDDFGGNTFIKLKLPSALGRSHKPTITQRLDDAMTAVGARQFERALRILSEISPYMPERARQIEIKALDGIGCRERLIEVLSPPQNVDEAMKLMSILLDAGRFDEAARQLEVSRTMIDPVFYAELAERIAVGRMAS
ncbi:MAG: hypothetical protein F4059_00635 [Gemmatimonadetes bacterium]|nr:hypothetical protein [Gemmatimonadota bacterium]